MRIAELGEASGVSVATLKFYLREGLLHPGEARAVNQADYDASHLRRVRLIRVLQDVGGLGLADIGRALAAVDDEGVNVHHAFGIAQDAMVPGRDRSSELHAAAWDVVDAFVRRHRLHVRREAQVRWMLVDALVALREAGWGLDLSAFDDRVPGALAEAEAELAFLPEDDRTVQMEMSVIGTVAVERAVAAVRRMALEHASAQRFGRRRPRRAGTT